MVARKTFTLDLERAEGRAAREAFWRGLWQKRNWQTYLLSPLSFLFLMTSRIRRTLYRTGFLEMKSVPVPVIVVGGIMIGGVGKTPVVASLARALQNAGFKPAIIARGYTLENAKKNLLPRAVTEISLPVDVGDEPILHHLKTGVPVWVGRNRSETARAVSRVHPECDVIICDDGLQHYALARDIEVVVMDEREVGNGWCLPAGPLRESPARLDEVDAVIRHYRCVDRPDALQKMGQTVPHKKTNYFDFFSYVSDAYDLLDPSYRLPLSYFAGKSTLAMAGIAQPEVFFKMLTAHNIYGATIALPDHFEFDAMFAERDAMQRAQYVLMTEKDAVKYRRVIASQCADSHQRYWVVPLEVMDSLDLQRLSGFLVQRLNEIAPEFNKDKSQ